MWPGFISLDWFRDAPNDKALYGRWPAAPSAKYVALWTPGDRTLPAWVGLRKQNGFIDAGSRAIAFVADLRRALQRTALVTIDEETPDPSQSIVAVEVQELEFSRGVYTARAVLRADTLNARCVFGETNAVLMSHQSYERLLSPTGESSSACASAIAETAADWIRANFKVR
jgi:hypothetical protein